MNTLIRFVKSLVKFSANLIASVGLVIVCCGLFVLYNKVGIEYQELYHTNADWLKTLQEYVFIILGVLIFLIGCAGLYGSRKNPKCQKTCLMFYQIGALAFFVLCTGLATFTLLYSDDVFGIECQGTTQFKEIDYQIHEAEKLLCSSICQCYITQSTYEDNKELFKGKNYTTNEDLEVKIKQIQKCPSYQPDQYAAAVSMMQVAESLLHCSGWCNPTKYYLFSDINDINSFIGTSCFTETKDFVQSTGKFMGYVLLGLGVLFGMNLIMVILICCTKEKDRRNEHLIYGY
ncbi:unnamed protein product (macronuclear) [Paramecium tetraurelia]|uniref:Tetraspanin family protein n=1 Tax=Paramecium tetraurelia TaxID=5888 RepID=A0DQ66_PARTE|nr:uncharacterized protein GSPATT00002583001 [Paramecium tetraurelia]CAK85183.1 unnamed protein product [Paramecium tetraurelia]|eukprot:XP_001452580.1 hypothetical protein (macronuclear) [Paramecium tetraurelia strain d4-2]